MKLEHLIHMKAKSECIICKRRSLNVSTAMLEKVMQMKSEHLIHMKKEKPKYPDSRNQRRSLNA